MLVDLVYEKVNDGAGGSEGASIAVLTLKNSKKLNALSTDFVNEIFENLQSLDYSRAKVLLVVSDCSKAFAAGVNIVEIHGHSHESAYLSEFMDDKWDALARLKIPVIAVVDGYALGGGFELALMADIIVASRRAIFGFPEVTLGVMPGLGGTQRLTRMVGPKIASEILMTGRFVDAEEALRLGLVNYIEEDSVRSLEKANDIARKIAIQSPMSVRMIKETVQMAQETGLSQGIKSERQMFRSLFSTSFKQKGTEAFLSKQKSKKK